MLLPSHGKPSASTSPPSLPPALPPTQRPSYYQQQSEARLLKLQQIPDPLPPPPRRQNQSAFLPPIPLPDYEYYCNDNDDIADEDIYVYGSDENEEAEASSTSIDQEKSRHERLRRIHTYALRYLAGDRKKAESGQDKRKATKPVEAHTRTMEVKRRKLAEDDREIMETPSHQVLWKWKKRKRKKKREREKQDEQVVEEVGKSVASANDSIPDELGPGKQVRKVRSMVTMSRNTIDTESKGKRKPSVATSKAKRAAFTPSRLKSRSVQEDGKGSKFGASAKREGRGDSLASKMVGKRQATDEPGRTIASSAQRVLSKASTLSKKAPPKKSLKNAARTRVDTEEFSAMTLKHPTKGHPRSESEVSPEPPVDLLRDTSAPMPDTSTTTVALTKTLDVLTAAWVEGDLREADFQQPNGPWIPVLPPVTPMTNLSISEPTPPEIFYGPSTGKRNDLNEGTNLTSKFLALRKEPSEPLKNLAEAHATQGRHRNTKRAGSAPVEVSKKTGRRVAAGTVAVKGRRKRKASEAIPEEEGAEDRIRERVCDDTTDWIPTSTDFKYKKGHRRKLTPAMNGPFSGIRKNEGNIEDTTVKGEEKGEHNGTEQQKIKRPRVIDFAALSPFGGGQVVTRSGEAYVSPSQDQKFANPVPLVAGQVGKDSSILNESTQQGISSARVPLKTVEDSNALKETVANAKSQEARTNRHLDPAQKSPEATEKFIDAHGQSAGAPGAEVEEQATDRKTTSITETAGLRQPHYQDAMTGSSNTVLLLAADRPLSQGPSSSPLNEPQRSATASAPRTNIDERLHESPWMSTQRQLSAAKRGFMSILDTPFSEKPSAALIPRPTSLAREPTERGNALHDISPHPASQILLPGTPAVINAASVAQSTNNSSPSTLYRADTSPTANLARLNNQRSERLDAPGKPVLRVFGSGDLTFSSPLVSGANAEDGTRNESVEGSTPKFSSFKTFDTPTKSQFGEFMQGFSPLRYSPPPGDAPKSQCRLESQSQSKSQFESQKDMTTIKLFSGENPAAPESTDSLDLSTELPAKPSTWIGANRASGLAIFDSSPGAPTASRSSLPAAPLRTTPRPESSRPIFFPTQEREQDAQQPMTPLLRRSSSSQPQFGQQSPGSKLAGDMLELMGDGVWDIEDELKKLGVKLPIERTRSLLHLLRRGRRQRGYSVAGRRELVRGGGDGELR
ncbi:hypothetical protein BDZ91DRAFT_788894 [Kalaharituber pfeilii]|nr:hypothetical protein BDZ91DRAFT_788894 [Kalaharituber pfeilii]